MFKPQGIVLHLSASTWGDASVIRKWHTDPEPQGRGWGDIGYHAVILNGRRAYNSVYDRILDGKIEPGRPVSAMGAHCKAGGMNQITRGVCCIGTPGAVPPGARVLKAGPIGRVLRASYMTDQQFVSLLHVVKKWCREMNVDPLGSFRHDGRQVPTITQHSDHDPGKPFCASINMPVFRRQVARSIA